MTSEPFTRRSHGLALALCLLLVAGSVAAAPTPRQRARALFRQGNKLFARKDFAGALEHYRKARRLFPSYKIDFNIGTALEQLKLPDRAAEHYEHFLGRVDRHKERRIYRLAAAKLLALRKQLVRVTIHYPYRGASVMAGGRYIGVTPLKYSFYLIPGTQRVVVSSRGLKDSAWSFTGEAGQYRRLTVPLARKVVKRKAAPRVVRKPLPRAPAPPRRETPFYKTWWFWTGVGVVVTGAVVTGGVLGSQGGGDDRMPRGELGEIR